VEELLGRVAADAVITVTTADAHAEVSTAALLSGLPVLCEKPAADTTSAALSMAAAAEVSDRLLMVSQSRRYWRNLAALRGQVARLGRIGIVECSFFRGPRFGGFRDEMPHSAAGDMAIHHFDLARDLIGSDPVGISCESFNPRWSWYAGDAAAQAFATFADGTRFSYTRQLVQPALETSWNGSGGSAARRAPRSGTATGHPSPRPADGTPIPAVAGTGPRRSRRPGGVRRRDPHGAVPSGEIHRNVMSLAMVEGAIRSAHTVDG
jgi:predicted dehydrogenase